MSSAKSIGAGVLLLLSFWCLGRAIETGLDPNPNRLEKRETVTAGLLLGLPAATAGSWLLWDRHRQKRLALEKRLRNTFFKLVRTEHGKITPLRFAMEANISGDTAKTYLSDRSLEYDATFEVNETGDIIYCFHLSDRSRAG